MPLTTTTELSKTITDSGLRLPPPACSAPQSAGDKLCNQSLSPVDRHRLVPTRNL